MKKVHFRLFGWFLLFAFALAAQVTYTGAIGATGWLETTPHSGGFAEFGILPSTTSRVFNVTDATLRPITFKAAAYQFTTGVETIVATEGVCDISLRVMAGYSGGSNVNTSASSEQGALTCYPAWLRGFYLKAIAGGMQTGTVTDPSLTLAIGKSFNAVPETLKTRLVLKAQKLKAEQRRLDQFVREHPELVAMGSVPPKP